ncbi:AAA family ATPase [Paenarthrobacter nitroguajacolicus]|uniref:AAA family ATPase n=1 Tax=Paenarthrobacter nitroguajacolicus TaxID=211146 RepID=UPI004054748E
MLIVLTGIDGSGKTTAARALVDSARADGRGALLLNNHAARRRMWQLSARYGWTLAPRVKDFIETGVRLFNVLVNHARAGQFDGLVVMDRHLHCQLALRQANGLQRGRLLPWLLEKLPAADVHVHFDTDPTIAHERVTARGTDQETVNDLRAFRQAYRSLPEFDDFELVDAGGEPGEVLARLNYLVAAKEPACA